MVCVLVFSSTLSKSQNFELLNVDFTSISKTSNSVGFENSELNINLPYHKDKSYFTSGLNYSNYAINYNFTEVLNTKEIDNFSRIKYTLRYFNTLIDNWGFELEISPIISSNFKSGLSLNDLYLNGSLLFNRTFNKSNLAVGLEYNSIFSTKTPIPVISYTNQINNKITYKIGFPENNVAYKINKKNMVNIFMMPRGFYSNISENLILNADESKAEKAKYLAMLLGLNLTHTVDEYWDISLNTGFQTFSKYKLLQNNKSIYSFKTRENFFAGIKVVLNINNKNK